MMQWYVHYMAKLTTKQDYCHLILDWIPFLTEKRNSCGHRIFEVNCVKCGRLCNTTKQHIIKLKQSSKNYFCSSCNGKQTLPKNRRPTLDNITFLSGLSESFLSHLTTKKYKSSRIFELACFVCGCKSYTTKYKIILSGINSPDQWKCFLCSVRKNGESNKKLITKRKRKSRYHTVMKRKLGECKLNWKCENCGVLGKEIQYLKTPYNYIDIHHIDNDRLNNVESNLKVLCRKCHEKIHCK